MLMPPANQKSPDRHGQPYDSPGISIHFGTLFKENLSLRQQYTHISARPTEHRSAFCANDAV